MKKQIKKETNLRRKEKTNKIVRFIIVLIIILAIIFFVLIILQTSFPESLMNLFRKPQMFNINDGCSLIFNKIVHQIKNEGDCGINCRNECLLEKMSYYDINFTSKSNSCNICNCYCK